MSDKDVAEAERVGCECGIAPSLLLSFPCRSNSTFQIAPRAVSIMNSYRPSFSKAKPLATRG